MKQCYRCRTVWTGYSPQPRTRDYCQGCGAYLHSCLNCHHFDHRTTNSCKLPDTEYIGPRDIPNYCEQFRIFDCVARADEDRVSRAKVRWERLFKA